MNQTEIYQRLIDLYAGRELPTELEAELDAHAVDDQALATEMKTLRDTVEAIQSQPSPEYTEESFQRILLKIYSRGIDLQLRSPDPVHLQYQLPIQS